MSSALLVRFRPAGPWRLGPDNGARTQAGKLLHSDSLYSAITLAMRDCGWMDEWIAATAESQTPAVRVSSGYPFTGSTLLVVPPRTVWPPPQGGKLRWKTARFVPLTLVPRLLAGEELADDQWAVDPVSECLLPVFRNSVATAPFRVVQRVLAPVDRVTGATENVDRVACLQFAQGGGIWFIAEFADDAARSTWAGRMRSVARLLADSGIGGGRSRGWGRSREPQFGNVELPEFLTGIAASAEGETAWWTVSLFSPAEADKVEWDRGTYTVVVRAGRTENGELKPASRMVAEGSVLVSGSPPAGMARNVSPAELSHAVYRSGIALTVRIPFQQRQRWELVDHAVAAAAAAANEPETRVPAPEDMPSGGDTAWDASAEQVTATDDLPAELTTEAGAQQPSSQAAEPQPTTEPGTQAAAADVATALEETGGSSPAEISPEPVVPDTVAAPPATEPGAQEAAPDADAAFEATRGSSAEDTSEETRAPETVAPPEAPEPGVHETPRDAAAPNVAPELEDTSAHEALLDTDALQVTAQRETTTEWSAQKVPSEVAEPGPTEPTAQETPRETAAASEAATEPETPTVGQPDAPAPQQPASPEPASWDEAQSAPASTDTGLIDEIPVGIDLPPTESPVQQPEAAEDVTGTDVLPGEDPNAAGIEPAADTPEDAGYPKKDEEDQP